MTSERSLQRWLAPIKAKIATAPRPDFELSKLRVLLAATVLVYVAWYVVRDGMTAQSERQALAVVFAFLVFATAIAAANVYAPRILKTTRILGIVVDNAVVTYALIVTGESGSVLLGAYLLITIGNSFRYGRFYWRLSHLLSVSGFAIVIAVSPFWSRHVLIGIEFLIALVIVPVYVGMLAERIKLARQQAEDALRAREIKADQGVFIANP